MTPPAPTPMRFAEACSTADETLEAADQASDRLREILGDGPIDLVLAFFNARHVPAADELAARLKERLAPVCLAGASGAAVITSSHELESGPALTLFGARLPGVEVRPFIMASSAWGEAMSDAVEFSRHTSGVDGAELVIVLSDPFTIDADRVLRAFNQFAPGVRVVGGLMSAGPRPQANAVFLNDWVAREGGIGIALKGALRVDVVVSQGCRPIGPPLTVTRADQNILIELDGQPALERAEQVLRDLNDGEREMLKHGLYLGRPVRGEGVGRGDYLIRNLLGADRDQGVIAIADRAVERERVRLHVRDADSAVEDLELLLAPQEFDSKAHGALLFTCNGRGRSFFGRPDRDISILQEALGGSIPVAGFYCAGEIGPVGERNHLHGQTASIAVLRPPSAPSRSATEPD
ncbi:MAG: hypothetical protein HOP12_15825 [Candidatus Eisenbacteria bacterium]|uniref:Histidine kinase n=1 Tax=Eiseniibacteriota bacterium TaxID=2212470 RepID=A0A849SSG7_UNCEI|nr:hypothetical protein [Candidatus Eisenbacteria bacterium]